MNSSKKPNHVVRADLRTDRSRNKPVATLSRSLKNEVRLLLLTGAVLGASGLINTTAAAAVQSCGKPSLQSNNGPAALLWENCEKSAWSLAVTGGGSDQLLTYDGTIKATRPATLVAENSDLRLEPNDILNKADKSNIEFRLFVAGNGKDGFDFDYPDGSTVCVDIPTPSGTLLVGPNRTAVKSPVNLRTLTQCQATACGTLAFDRRVERGAFLWRDCDSNQWRLRVTAGGQSALDYIGSIVSDSPLETVAKHSLESSDVFKTPEATRVEFKMHVGGTGKDGINFNLADNSSACIDTGGSVLVGPNRTLVQSPFDINTLQSCASDQQPVDEVVASVPSESVPVITAPPVVTAPIVEPDPVDPTPAFAYLNDADTTDSVEFVGDSDIGDLPFPRITTGPIKQVGPAEQFSKYGMIAVKGFKFDWLSKVQEINPDTKGLRIFCPQEYQGYGDTGPCRLGNGLPFEGTSNATAGCDIYAGHWLYEPGTRLSAGISATANTVKVDDASRFQAGRYAIIYSGGPGAFVNPEHVRVSKVNTSTNTLTLSVRGYKSSKRSHGSNAIMAEHVIGNGDNQEPLNWAYNLSTTSPRDASGRQMNEVLADWIARNYDKDQFGKASDVQLEGILFDSDFHFIEEAGHGKQPDVDNDLVLDHGVSEDGDNLWGEGLDGFYTMVRERLPNVVLVGGVVESRGYTSLNGTQLEGWPQRNMSGSAVPDYRSINSRMSTYSVQMHHGSDGPRYSEGISKMPTKLYSAKADVPPTSNAPFRFGFGLILLDDGYYGQQNWNELDLWWDEYAVDVEPGSSTYGHAIASTPDNEARVRQHSGWMGYPMGARYRVFDEDVFSPEKNLIDDGDFDTDIGDWSGWNVDISRATKHDNRLDGEGALYIGQHKGYQYKEGGAAAWGPLLNLSKGQEYTFAFGIKSSEARSIRVDIGEISQQLYIPGAWSRQVMTFTAPRNGNYRLKLNVGRESTDLWLDSVHLFKGNADVFRRDFDNATVVVNATSKSRTVDLKGTFKRIKGTGQDWINNGATVKTVTIKAYDAAILVRP